MYKLSLRNSTIGISRNKTSSDFLILFSLKGIIRVMFNYIKKLKNLKILFKHTAIDILTYPHHSLNYTRIYEEPKTVGAYVLDQTKKKVVRIFAKKVILATGGLSSIFLHSTNPADAVPVHPASGSTSERVIRIDISIFLFSYNFKYFLKIIDQEK